MITEFDFPDNPSTPHHKYGINPDDGLKWHNNIIDMNGDVFNPRDTGCATGTYKDSRTGECEICDSMDCPDFTPPDCGQDWYRPDKGAPNDKGFLDCKLCNTTECPDFVIPEC